MILKDATKHKHAEAADHHLSDFEDNSFDLIFSSNLLEHLPNPDKCIKECKRLIKPNGFIIHTVPNNTWKIFHLIFYYPYIIKRVFSKLRKEKKINTNEKRGFDNNPLI